MKTKNKFLIYLVPSLFVLHIIVRGLLASQQETQADFISHIDVQQTSPMLLIEDRNAIALR